MRNSFMQFLYSSSAQHFGKIGRPMYLLGIVLIIYCNFGYKVWDIYPCVTVESTLYLGFLAFIRAYSLIFSFLLLQGIFSHDDTTKLHFRPESITEY